ARPAAHNSRATTSTSSGSSPQGAEQPTAQDGLPGRRQIGTATPLALTRADWSGAGSRSPTPVSRKHRSAAVQRAAGQSVCGAASPDRYAGQESGSSCATSSRPVAMSSADTPVTGVRPRSEEHTSELQSRENLVCRLLLE